MAIYGNRTPTALATGAIQQTVLKRGQDRLQSRTRDRFEANFPPFLQEFRAVTRGTRFDMKVCGSRRINGVRNIRQALASPHPAVRLTIRRGSQS
jgi:hypothetical protein